MKKNQSDARRARRVAARYGESPVKVFDLGDGLYEFVLSFGPSPCACVRCEMLQALSQKSDGPPPAEATHQFETLDWPEVRRDQPT